MITSSDKPTSSENLSRADRIVVWLLLLAGVVLAASRFNDLLGLTGDNAAYLLLARNLASGAPYDNAGFPWGYPALLTPGVALFGPENLIEAVPWLKLLTAISYVAALPLLYLLFRLRHPALFAAAAVLLFAVNDVTLIYTNDLMTELPFILATAGALLFWYRRIEPPVEQGWSEEDEQVLGLHWRELLVAAVLLVLPYYLRTVGLALIAAGPVALLLRRRVREALLLGVMLALLAAPWAIFSNSSNPEQNYTAALLLRDPYQPELGKIDSVGEFVTRLGDTAVLYGTYIWPTMLLPGLGIGWTSSLWLLFLALALIGFIMRLVKRIEISELYVAAFIFILLAWPWRADRFLMPVMPFLLHYSLEPLVALGRMITASRQGNPPDEVPAKPEVRLRALNPGNRYTAIIAVLLLALAVPNLLLDAKAAQMNGRYWQGDPAGSGLDESWQRFFDASRWSGENTPPGSVILSRKSTLTEIFAGRPSILPPLIPPEQYPSWLREHNVSYILEDSFNWSVHTLNYVRPALARDPANYKLVYETSAPLTRVWQVLHNSAQAP